MTCTEVRDLLPDLALGDLDAEPAAAAAAHLKECAACRAGQAALGRTVGALRGARPVSPSTERRSAAVAAMTRAHAEQSRPRSWAPWATAAAFLLAVVGALSARGGGTAYTVDLVTGRAGIRDQASGTWRPVVGGMKVSVGDRLVTQRGCKVRLVGGAALLCLDQETSLEVVQPRRVTLDRGRLLATGDSLIVTDMLNNSVRVEGRVEISIREVTALVAGSLEPEGRDAVLPGAKTLVEKSLVVRVESGEAALDGARDQRLRAAAGEEGRFQFGGKPETAPAADRRVGSWFEDR